MEKKKFSMEHRIISTPASLFRMLSTAEGLGRWIADKVEADEEGNFLFYWGRYPNAAKVIDKQDNSFIRFQMEEDEATPYFFEMAISKTELSGDVSLLITDFAEEDETEDRIQLWQNDLKRLAAITGTPR